MTNILINNKILFFESF